jgi:hypothetical protein
VGPLGRSLFLQGVEIPAHRRFRHAEFTDEFFQRGKAANPDDVEQPATAVLVLHGVGTPCWMNYDGIKAELKHKM